MNEPKLIKTIQKEIYVFDSLEKKFSNDVELGSFIRKLIQYEVKTYNSTK